MPDLTGFTALDVALGLAFLYFLLSTVVATIQEMVAGWLGWRAQDLEKALRSWFAVPKEGEDPLDAKDVIVKVNELLGKPRISALVDDDRNQLGPLTKLANGNRRRSPSYVPARAFALTVLDTFAPDLPGKPGQPAPSDPLAAAAGVASNIQIESLRRVVADALNEGRASLEEIRREVERSFDQLMDRCSGWYKRRAQMWIAIFAALVTIGLNVDTFHVADRLAKDDALRAAVVERATAAAEGDQASATTDEESPEKRVAKQIDEVEELGLPVGWSAGNGLEGAEDLPGRVAGWAVTWLALLLGAPFWFDVLGKFARLRNAGNREGTMKDDDRAAEDRDDPSRRRPAVG